MSPMAVELLVSKRRVAHVPGCIRLTKGAHPAITEPWDGKGTIFPCRSCLFPTQGKRRRPLPCAKCGQSIARPCPHNGVMRVVERTGGPKRQGGVGTTQRILTYPDLAIERAWLASLLDS